MTWSLRPGAKTPRPWSSRVLALAGLILIGLGLYSWVSAGWSRSGLAR